MQGVEVGHFVSASEASTVTSGTIISHQRRSLAEPHLAFSVEASGPVRYPPPHASSREGQKRCGGREARPAFPRNLDRVPKRHVRAKQYDLGEGCSNCVFHDFGV